jgi:hypothetical protein
MPSQTLLYASVVTAGLAFSSAAYANVLIAVDKSTQHMTVSVDGFTRYDWPVSTGRPGFDTPNGTFHPQWMSQMHYSKQYENAPMPHSIFFTKGDAIHGFTDTPFGLAAVSHGCVRLPPEDAAALYQVVSQEGMPNTTIVVRGRIPRRPLVAQRGWSTQGPQNYAEQGYGQPGYGQPGYGYSDRGFGQPPAYSHTAYGPFGQRMYPPQPRPAYYNYGGGRYQQSSRGYQQPARGYQQPYGGGYQQPYGGYQPGSPY